MKKHLTAEQRAREESLVETVRASFEGAPDERLREIMQALTTHLHAFIREVRLTEQEWKAGIDFLTAAGHLTDDGRLDAGDRREQRGLR
jgi:hydroxyquinol 1,2-dioxygenase